jgi:methylated-DNA-[protein]-cysteine S-methyltransferase
VQLYGFWRGQGLRVSAVGTANGRNPVSIIVPCHRAIGADGTLTGYSGGLDRREWLVRHEASWPAAKW